MDKNYYDILQINKNASPEIIEKAYKVLAKKYHPDLQTEENKKQAEEILKEINEAYEVLSNPDKKKEYDFLLLEREKANTFSNFENNSTNSSEEDNLGTTCTNNFSRENIPSFRQPNIEQEELLRRKQEIAYQEQLQQARQKAYHDAYIQDLRNRGYKIRYRKSLKDYIRIFVTIIVVVLVLFSLWQLPFVKSFFANLYKENALVHYIVDLFSNIFSS